MMWLAFIAAWVSTSAAVSVAICVTGKWQLLWFMIIPLFISGSSSTQTKQDDEKEKNDEKTNVSQ